MLIDRSGQVRLNRELMCQMDRKFEYNLIVRLYRGCGSGVGGGDGSKVNKVIS